MTSRHGVHATTQTAFRLPEGLLASLKDAAGKDERTMTDITVEALTDWLSRRERVTTSAPPAERVSPPRSRKPREDTAPEAVFVAARKPRPADADCPHPKARVHKGLCGACGTNVGTRAGGK